MYECGSTFGCLYEVCLESGLEQYENSSCYAHVLDHERLVVESVAEKNVVYPSSHVFHIGRKTEDRHKLGCGCDIKTRLGCETVCTWSETCDYTSERTVVYVKHPLPEHFLERKSFSLVVVDIVVQKSGNHIVCRSHGMHVTGEMEVDLLHRHHLGVSAACSSTLHSEAWAEGWLAEGNNRILADLVKPESKTYGYGGLADTGLCGGDRCDKNQFALGYLFLVNKRTWHLRHIVSVLGYFLFRNSDTFGNFCDSAHFNASCNFDVRLHFCVLL